MTGGLTLSDLIDALHGLPPGPTAVVVVVLGLLAAAPKVLKVAPKFLRACGLTVADRPTGLARDRLTIGRAGHVAELHTVAGWAAFDAPRNYHP